MCKQMLETITYHMDSLLVMMVVVDQDTYDSSFHSMDSHLCTVASGPNEKRTQVGIPI